MKKFNIGDVVRIVKPKNRNEWDEDNNLFPCWWMDGQMDYLIGRYAIVSDIIEEYDCPDDDETYELCLISKNKVEENELPYSFRESWLRKPYKKDIPKLTAILL